MYHPSSSQIRRELPKVRNSVLYNLCPIILVAGWTVPASLMELSGMAIVPQELLRERGRCGTRLVEVAATPANLLEIHPENPWRLECLPTFARRPSCPLRVPRMRQALFSDTYEPSCSQ